MPLEENIEKWHKDKTEKHIKELGDNMQPGWELKFVCGEVGAKGWVPPSFTKDMRNTFGVKKTRVRKLADDCSWVARQCSYVIWLNRDNKEFTPHKVIPPGSERKETRKGTDKVVKRLKPSALHVKLSNIRVVPTENNRKPKRRKKFSPNSLDVIMEAPNEYFF